MNDECPCRTWTGLDETYENGHHTACDGHGNNKNVKTMLAQRAPSMVMQDQLAEVLHDVRHKGKNCLREPSDIDYDMAKAVLALVEPGIKRLESARDDARAAGQVYQKQYNAAREALKGQLPAVTEQQLEEGRLFLIDVLARENRAYVGGMQTAEIPANRHAIRALLMAMNVPVEDNIERAEEELKCT